MNVCNECVKVLDDYNAMASVQQFFATDKVLNMRKRNDLAIPGSSELTVNVQKGAKRLSVGRIAGFFRGSTVEISDEKHTEQVSVTEVGETLEVENVLAGTIDLAQELKMAWSVGTRVYVLTNGVQAKRKQNAGKEHTKSKQTASRTQA